MNFGKRDIVLVLSLSRTLPVHTSPIGHLRLTSTSHLTGPPFSAWALAHSLCGSVVSPLLPPAYLRNHILCLPFGQCLKAIFSCILSSVRVAYKYSYSSVAESGNAPVLES